MSARAWASAGAVVLVTGIVTAGACDAQSVTPFVPGPNTQLQSGITPFYPPQNRSGVTTLATSGLNSGVTSIQANPLLETTPVQARSFSQGGVSTVPGGDTFTNSTNSTNATSATSGLGYSNGNRRP